MNLAKTFPELSEGQLRMLEAYIQKEVSDRVAERVWQLTGTSEVLYGDSK